MCTSSREKRVFLLKRTKLKINEKEIETDTTAELERIGEV